MRRMRLPRRRPQRWSGTWQMGARGLTVECLAFYMERRADSIAPEAHRAGARGPKAAAWASVAGVCMLSVVLACAMTFPLVIAPASLGRTATMDGLYSIWNV